MDISIKYFWEIQFYVTYASQLPASACNLLWKSYISNKVAGANGVSQGVF